MGGKTGYHPRDRPSLAVGGVGDGGTAVLVEVHHPGQLLCRDGWAWSKTEVSSSASDNWGAMRTAGRSGTRLRSARGMSWR